MRYRPGRYYITLLPADAQVSYCTVQYRSDRFSHVARKARKLSMSGEFQARLWDGWDSRTVILFRKGAVVFTGKPEDMWAFLRSEQTTSHAA